MSKISNFLLVLTFGSLGTVSSLAYGADLKQAYTAALEKDPVYRSATANRLAAAAISRQSLAGLLPSANLVFSSGETSSEGTSSLSAASDYSTTYSALTVRQPLYGYGRWIQRKQGTLGEEAAQIAESASGQSLLVRVTDAYFGVLAAADNLEFARAEKKAVERQLEQTQQRFKVGLTAITDVHEAQARYDLTVTGEIAAENGLVAAKEALIQITDQTYDNLAPLGDKLQLTRPQPEDMTHWIEQALNNNQALQAANKQFQIAQEEVSRRRAGHHPTLDLVAEYSDTQVDNDGTTVTDKQDTEIRFELVVPLFAGGGVSASVSEGIQRMEAARLELERQRRLVRSQARQAYLGIGASLSRVQALQQALVSSKTALDATQAGFEVGTRTIVDVLNSQRGLHQAQRDLARAKYDYLLAQLQLKQAAGLLQDSDLEQINGWLNPGRPIDL